MANVKLELPYTTNFWKTKGGKQVLSNRYVERNIPGMTEIFDKLWQAQSGIITKERIGTALIYGQLPGEIFTDIDRSFADFFPSVYKPFLQAAMIDASIGYGRKDQKAAALNTIKFPGLMAEVNQKLGINQAFDVSSKKVQDFLLYESGYLITQMSESQKDAIRRLFAKAVSENWGLPRTVDTLKQGISLTEKLSNALTKKYDDEYEIAYKRFTEEFTPPYSVARAQIAASRVAALEQERYHKFLQKYRARMIARTELNRAKNETELQCLDQLKESGKIKGAFKRWVRHGTTDPWESSIINDGVRIPYDQPFTVPSGSTMTSNMYPCEINERCGLEHDLEV